MLLTVLTSLAAHASPLTAEVSRGWYLWETGRDFEATELSQRLVDEHPEAIPAIGLYVAMQVAAARGASVEAEYREQFSQDPSQPVPRVALAAAITWRHLGAGAWCDDVRDLVVSVVDGEPHAWATVVEREMEHRCEDGNTDHADAELGRLARDPASPVWVDGILARAESGYVRPELADALEQVWAEAPERLDRAPGLWDVGTSGPARGRARRTTRKALRAAVDSGRTTVVWAALKAYRALGWDDQAAEAKRALQELDAEAQLDLARDRHTIADPPIYAAIDACFGQNSETAIRACADALPDPGPGAVGAYLHYRRFLALRAFGEPESALNEAIAAWQADPSLTSYARVVVVASLDVPEPTPEIVAATRKASEALLAEAPEIERGGTTVARRWARDLDLAGQVLERDGDPSRAADRYRRALQLEPSAARRLKLGRALADAKQPAPAVLHLTRGLVEAMDQPELVREARQRLDVLAPLWGRRDANAILAEAVGGRARPSPLLGEVLEPDAWGFPADVGAPPTVRLVLLWGALYESPRETLAVLETVATYVGQNADVGGVSVDVGIRKAGLPEGIELRHVSSGPLPVQSLGLVTVPTVLVLDADYRLRTVLTPFENDPAADEALIEAVDAVREASEP